MVEWKNSLTEFIYSARKGKDTLTIDKFSAFFYILYDNTYNKYTNAKFNHCINLQRINRKEALFRALYKTTPWSVRHNVRLSF